MTNKEQTVTIRRASLDDLENIMRIERAQFGAHSWSDEVMRAELESEHAYYLVAARAGSLVGYAGLLAPQGSSDADIQTIAVSADHQGNGIGRALFESLLDEADRRGAARVFLEVRADNPAAIALYESTGFITIDTRKAYYQPESVDALVMARGVTL